MEQVFLFNRLWSVSSILKILKGRGGTGSIYVWASGDGSSYDDGNCAGYASSLWTISINSAINSGRTMLCHKSCSSTLAFTFNNGRKWSPEAGVPVFPNGTVPRGQHSDPETELSARPAASVSLQHRLPETHHQPGFRQHTVAVPCSQTERFHTANTQTRKQSSVRAQQPPCPSSTACLRTTTSLASDSTQWLCLRFHFKTSFIHNEVHQWRRNWVGLEFDHLFGYGVLDTGAMVKMAKDWKMVPERFHCVGGSVQDLEKILTTGKLVLTRPTDACEGKENFVHYLEHVQAVVTVSVTRRGDLNINVMSPVGTKSILLSQWP
ncbi:unnamed protein product [Rangifer tarandus platyrhynchus]|uniref:Uncharacterized protein n=2 Tax=Rangifer tarandus platyrhynchus TaxID=3082113 RepID=A0ACB0FKB7_RANTA|nr:unnamed protein product [Rangifer tarandus platyrhynchus]CAI9713600.1 unnamed protein product [Rangifer tarandus platyrhynchus]